MKIKIDRDGYLWLERAGKMKQAWCPTHFRRSPCGDWCAKFREDSDSKVAEVFLCDTEHYCDIKDFSDERGGE